MADDIFMYSSRQYMTFPDPDPFFGHSLPPLSSEVPSSDDITSARIQIEIAENELQKIDHALSLMLAKRAVILFRLNRCRMAIAPYKKLPEELVRNIFLFCVPETQATDTVPNEEHYNSRLRITQICSDWRKIAFGEPLLWNLSIYPHNGLVDLAESWFQQCFCSRLGLSVHEDAVDPGNRVFERFSMALRVIFPYSRKLKQLGMVVDRPLLKTILLLPFENLEELALTLHSRGYIQKTTDLQFAKPTPSLRSVALANLSSEIEDEKFFLGLPLAQLTRLKLTGNIMAALVPEILNQCGSLEECIIECVYHEGFPPLLPPNTPIFLPTLRELTITFCSHIAEQLLCSFEVPNLRSLVTDVDFSSPRFRSFFQHLSSIRHITIPDTGLRGSFIDEGLFSFLPHLVEFNTGAYPLHPSTLMRIGIGDLLPNVSCLEIPENDLQRVVDMLNARWATVHTHHKPVSLIRRMVVSCADGGSASKGAFNTLRSYGIEVIII